MAIKFNELRLGNWVNSPKGTGYESGFIKVTSLGYRGINHWRDMGASGEGAYEDLEPIPLSSDILEKCGFEKMSLDRNVWYELKIDDKMKFSFEKDIVEFGIQGVAQFEWANTKIKHLHQLQNLYYALTCKKLEINL